MIRFSASARFVACWLCSAAGGAIESSNGRTAISFDFGWWHRTGLRTPAGPDDPAIPDPDPGPHPPEAQIDYKTDGWTAVQLPHDALIAARPSLIACPTGCSGKSFLPRPVLWYRKTFVIPVEWAGSVVWLDFEGSFALTTVWVNGVVATTHDNGYTPFRLRLDNISNVEFGKATVIALFVDPNNGDEGRRDSGSGWWYEGGGLYRHVHLVRANPVHVEQDGFFAYSTVEFSDENASYALLYARVDIANTGVEAATVCFVVDLSDVGGTHVAQTTPTILTISAMASGVAAGSVVVTAPKIWTASTPSLYILRASLYDGSVCSGRVLDSVQEPHGFRTLRYDANKGLFLNYEHFKVRGFCDHDNFAVVGMAIPERIHLFRAQASRAIGGNGRRASHNPPDIAMLDVYDRLGIVVMDENRLFANNTKYINNMGVLVKRDRNHPSVIIWSFCNEDGCEGEREEGGPRFREVTYEYDGSRPTLANMFTFNDLLSKTVDVQGFSHRSREKLDDCHAQMPHKPIFMSECCSCNTMRDEDEGHETSHDNPHDNSTQMSFNARCAESNDATNASDGVSYAIGTMVWTLFDYYGEPPDKDGEEVSSTYGQYDLCGFPKASAFWYRVQWLLNVPDGPDKTFPTKGKHEVYIVESWEGPDSFPSTVGKKTRTIHAYSSAPVVELLVNGKSQGSRGIRPMREGPGSYGEWIGVPWEAGTLAAIARDADGVAVATTTRHTNGKPVALSLSIDAPSPATGTGSAVLLDGQDVALLRALVVDSAGNAVHLASNNISFRILSGPGFVQGSHSGNPRSKEANNEPWHLAYHGLVRAVIRVNSAAARPRWERELLARIDSDGLMVQGAAAMKVGPIVVEASSPGFEAVQISIPVSTDPLSDSVVAVAQAGAGKAVDFFAQAAAAPREDIVTI